MEWEKESMGKTEIPENWGENELVKEMRWVKTGGRGLAFGVFQSKGKESMMRID